MAEQDRTDLDRSLEVCNLKMKHYAAQCKMAQMDRNQDMAESMGREFLKSKSQRERLLRMMHNMEHLEMTKNESWLSEVKSRTDKEITRYQPKVQKMTESHNKAQRVVDNVQNASKKNVIHSEGTSYKHLENQELEALLNDFRLQA